MTEIEKIQARLDKQKLKGTLLGNLEKILNENT